MSYRVKIESFEGAFDLLLYLVARQKIDIGAISIVEVTDQYLEYLARMQDLDLDVASDFLYVAAQLLEIKAASLLPREQATYGDELDDLSPDEARDILSARLATYMQFKKVAHALDGRMENEGRMHPRSAGIEPEFLGLLPDYLDGVTLRGLAVICADLAARKDIFLLEAEHIAAMPIPLELHVEAVHRQLATSKHVTFNELVGKNPDTSLVVVTFLAILELYKRSIVSLEQDELFGDIKVDYLDEDTRKALASSQVTQEGDAPVEEHENAGEPKTAAPNEPIAITSREE